MIACPFCAARSSWVCDKRNGDGYVRRRRQCDDCGERFTTREVIVDSVRGRVHDKWKALKSRARARGVEL